MSTNVVLAAGGSTDPTGESVKSGPIGLVVIILLCIGCYFLFKSMSKHLRRVREEFPSQLPGDSPDVSGPASAREDVAGTPDPVSEQAPIADASSTSADASSAVGGERQPDVG
jgi:hypothetical protein